MDLTRPYLAVFSRVAGATLLALSRTTGPMTGREVSRLAGASQPAIQAALDHLVDHGLVTSQPAGRANLYVLNRDHLAMPAVEAALSIRANLVERIREVAEAWRRPASHISLFGSMARGEGGIHSDVDLLIIRADADADDYEWRDQVAALERDIEKWTGNRASPVDISWNDLREMAHAKKPILAAIRRDGILVHGAAIDEHLKYEVVPVAGAKRR